MPDVRGVIRNRLWRAKREAAIERFVADPRGKAAVQENLEPLSNVRVRDK